MKTMTQKSVTTKMKVTVYTPESQMRHPIRLLRNMVGDLFLSFELAYRLMVRDISAQYRLAFLGLAWALIMPLVNTVTWIFLNSSGIIAVSETELPYPVYVFTGTMLWQIFAEALQSPSQQVNSAKSMLSKINFPKEAIILSGIGQTLFNAIIKIVILVPGLIILGINPGWTLALLPVGILSLVLFGTTLGLLVAPMGALFDDVRHAVTLVSQFWMYITPVVFTLPENGWVATLFNINPLTPLILTSRAWLTNTSPTHLQGFLIINIFSIFILVVVWAIYRVSIPILVERMNA